jgi:hypothetical protein
VVSAVSVSTLALARLDPAIFVCQGVAVRREWELDDLIASWTLVDDDLELLVGKRLRRACSAGGCGGLPGPLPR